MTESAYATLIGSVGIGILLVAFLLNMLKKLSEDSMAYLGLNVLGCAVACAYAIMMSSIPFVILEIVWGGAALVRLIQVAQKSRS